MYCTFRLSKTLGPRQTDENDLQGPTYRFTAHPEQHVESMLETEHFLFTGTSGEISGWDWKAITSNKASKAKVSWTINLPAKRYKLEVVVVKVNIIQLRLM